MKKVITIFIASILVLVVFIAIAFPRIDCYFISSSGNPIFSKESYLSGTNRGAVRKSCLACVGYKGPFYEIYLLNEAQCEDCMPNNLYNVSNGQYGFWYVFD